MSDRITTDVSTGPLVGLRADGVDRYLGVPYAAAPVGARRFGLPEPHAPWSAPRDATVLGATAPQNDYGPSTAKLLATKRIRGDEILTVNVWSPTDAVDAPVMVWVHGGSFAHGSNALDGYDGTAFARDGVVLVAVNYRLAVEGFAVLDGAPTNLGLEDIAAALRWVRAEIGAFGGDPGNVTAFGESAGAMALGTLLASPDAARLLDRVVLQSGPPSASSPKTAGRLTARIARRLGLRATRDAFVRVPPERLLRIEAEVTAGSTPLTGGLGHGPVIGDRLVPGPPLEALLEGAATDIPVLLGWNTEEWRLWFVPSALVDRIGPLFVAAARLRFRIGPRIMAAYRRAHPGASRGELFGNLAMDLVLRLPFRRLAESRRARGARTWAYEFAWRSPVAGLGAAHAMELGFVFDRIASDDWVRLGGADAPQSLADTMHGAWIRFARTGDPGWPEWDAERTTMRFDTESAVVRSAGEDELDAWPQRTIVS